MQTTSLTSHDDHPAQESAFVDAGLGRANAAAAPLHEVQQLACSARSASGAVVGGALGRWWGRCCELQQLWAEPSVRRQGIGARLVRAFEAQAVLHGCRSFYLETFSFQAPALYRALGYEVDYERNCFPHGIVKFHPRKELPGP